MPTPSDTSTSALATPKCAATRLRKTRRGTGATLGDSYIAAAPFQPLQRAPGGRLLRLLLGGALALGQRLALEQALHAEAPLVAGALLGQHHVLGQGLAPGLQRLLQRALGVHHRKVAHALQVGRE